MKKISYLLLALVSVFATSCYNHWHYDFEEIEYGFESEIHEYSKELVLMRVTDSRTNIQLNGSIELYGGKLDVKLISPDGEIVFEESISESTSMEVNKSFLPQKGYWKLKYESDGGEGFINLHLNQ